MVKDQIYYNDINVVHESMNKMIVKVETYTLFSKLQWLTERVIVFIFLLIYSSTLIDLSVTDI